MCNHLFAINVLHGSEREEIHSAELLEELQRKTSHGRLVHHPATPDSLGEHMDWFDYCPRCGTPLLPLIQAACDLANNACAPLIE